MDRYVKFPNTLILDKDLLTSTKRVALALYAYRDGDNVAQCSRKRLSELSGCCNSTVNQALNELESHHYIKQTRCYRYRYNLPNKYTFDMEQDCSFIPRNILKSDLTHAAFAVYLYLVMEQGEANKCTPSLNKTARDLQLVKSTVCLAIKELETKGYISREYEGPKKGGAATEPARTKVNQISAGRAEK